MNGRDAKQTRDVGAPIVVMLCIPVEGGTELSKAKSLTPPSLLKQEVHAVVSVAAAVIGVDMIISVTWSMEESDVLTGVMKFDAASL